LRPYFLQAISKRVRRRSAQGPYPASC
jgi:hypothetical protein